MAVPLSRARSAFCPYDYRGGRGLDGRRQLLACGLHKVVRFVLQRASEVIRVSWALRFGTFNTDLVVGSRLRRGPTSEPGPAFKTSENLPKTNHKTRGTHIHEPANLGVVVDLFEEGAGPHVVPDLRELDRQRVRAVAGLRERGLGVLDGLRGAGTQGRRRISDVVLWRPVMVEGSLSP